MASNGSQQVRWLLIYLPYLRLSRDVSIGPWTLISSKRTRGRWPNAAVGKAARQFMAKHRTAFGRPLDSMTVVTRDGRAAQDEHSDPSDEEFHALQAAVTIGVLCSNPPWKPDGDSWRVSTSDNCLLRATWITEGMTWFAVERGSVVQTLSGGHRLDRRGDVIAAPLELHLPSASQLDEEMAAAAYSVITGPDSELAGRLLSSVRWLSQAWANTPSIGSDTRAVFVKTSFEALLGTTSGAWDQAKRLRRRFDLVSARYEGAELDVLWSGNESERHQVQVGGSIKAATDLQAWYLAFARHRNATVHEGSDPAGSTYTSNDAYSGPLFWVGERVLRDLIRCELTLATAQPLVFNGIGRALRTPEAMAMLEAAFEGSG